MAKSKLTQDFLIVSKEKKMTKITYLYVGLWESLMQQKKPHVGFWNSSNENIYEILII